MQSVYLTLAIAGLGAALTRQTHLNTAALLAIGSIAYATAAIIMFWIRFVLLPSSLLANILSVLWLSLTIYLGVRTLGNTKIRASIQQPLIAFLGATILLVFWINLFTTETDPIQIAATRWIAKLPGDNRIPLDLAISFSEGRIRSPLHGDWLSSDRPPLQTALFLASPGYLIAGPRPATYQSIAMAYQMFVLLSVWTLVRSIHSSAKTALLAMATVLFTPLTLVNAAFVWPKLLSVAFLMYAFTLHFTPAMQKIDYRKRGLWVGLSVALALLGHGGSMFVVLAMGITGLIFRSIGSRRYVIIALSVTMVTYMPWQAYQKFSDPPGNRLVKWHLAGVIPIDQRSTSGALIEEYGKLSLAEITSAKIDNIKTVGKGYAHHLYLISITAYAFFTAKWAQTASYLNELRSIQFFYMPAGMGIIGLSLYISFFGFISISKIKELTAVTLLTLVIWSLLMFNPGSTIIHQGSLFPEIALISGAIIVAAQVSDRLATSIAILHILSTLFFYLPPAV